MAIYVKFAEEHRDANLVRLRSTIESAINSGKETIE